MNSKMLCVLFFVLLLLPLKSEAVRKYSTCPYPEHEVVIGYGGFSADQLSVRLATPFANRTINNILDRNANSYSVSAIGPINLTYKYFFKEHFSFGVGLVYAQNNIKSNFDVGTDLTDKIHSFAILPSFDFYYMREPKIALYGSVKLGADLNSRNDGVTTHAPQVGFAYQVCPIGMRVGRSFGVVVELGFGNYGIVNGGFSYRQDHRNWGM